MSTSSDLVMWGGVAPLVLLNPVIVFLLAIACEAVICAIVDAGVPTVAALARLVRKPLEQMAVAGAPCSDRNLARMPLSILSPRIQMQRIAVVADRLAQEAGQCGGRNVRSQNSPAVGGSPAVCRTAIGIFKLVRPPRIDVSDIPP